MEKYIFDGSNGLWYELQGDYYLLRQLPRNSIKTSSKKPFLWKYS